MWVILYQDLGGVPGDVYEQTLTLDGVSEHRNLCALVDVWEHSILGRPISGARFSANFGRMNDISGSYTHYKPQVSGKEVESSPF